MGRAVNHDCRLVTSSEAARRLGMSASSFANWRSRGLLPGPIPGTNRYDWKAIDAALDKLSGLTPVASRVDDPELADWLKENGYEN